MTLDTRSVGNVWRVHIPHTFSICTSFPEVARLIPQVQVGNKKSTAVTLHGSFGFVCVWGSPFHHESESHRNQEEFFYRTLAKYPPKTRTSPVNVIVRDEDWLLLQEYIFTWGDLIATELGKRKGVSRALCIDWDTTRDSVKPLGG